MRMLFVRREFDGFDESYLTTMSVSDDDILDVVAVATYGTCICPHDITHKP